jgi:uncharacterized membrane protein YhiD involved in acid resistance
MPDFFQSALPEVAAEPVAILGRLIGAMVLGAVVAFIYRRTRGGEPSGSFTVTLVLLSILIAMVTQVIGDNVARAFSLVGALSIVRFRTVVRDTQDTAFVIFAVAVGMAVGASHAWVAVSGIGIVGLATWWMSRTKSIAAASETYLLQVRVGLGHDLETLVGGPLESLVRSRRLVSLATARQGMAVEASYRVELRADNAAAELVRTLNRLDGIQNVSLQRTGFEED